MIITDDRVELNKSLEDPKTTIFLIAGQTNSKAEQIHTLIESKKWDDWQRWFLITDSSLLTLTEKQTWFAGATNGYYAVLGGRNLPKIIAQQGPITDLLNADGRPGYFKIRDAFLAGDEL